MEDDVRRSNSSSRVTCNSETTFEDRVRRALQVGLNPVELSLLHRHVRLGFMPLFQLGRLKTGYIP